MIKKTSKQNSKEKKIKNDTKNKKKQAVLKKTKSSNLNSKTISNKPKPKKTSKVNSTKRKKDIILKRSSGREEKFDTNKLTQTVSRSGVSFPVARDVAKSITKKIKKSAQNKSTGTTKKKQQQQQSSVVATKQQKLKINTNKKEAEKVIVTASQIKNLVDDELKDRNQQDHSPSFSGNTTIGEESSMKITLDDREPVMDKVAANKNKVLFDPSKQKGSS
ncbi:MAG TPA: hypothetical protein VF222_12845 [Nitrososphaeraceae archaeon]